MLAVPQPCSRDVTRQALCSLMRYLDANFTKIPSNRVHDGAFLSYCCSFGPMLAGPLIQGYAEHEDRSEIEAQIVTGFVQWLGCNGHQIFAPDACPAIKKSI